jgi:hypothetical protein
MAERKPLTPERLREVLHYDPDTGEWTWRKTTRNGHRKPGDRAGWRNPAGYLVMWIDRHQRKGHRLAFLYMTGRWPRFGVDHRDGNPSNDRWQNLRDASQSQNCLNRKRNCNNTSGFKGVRWSKDRRKWVAYIRLHGRRYHLGYFDTPEAAHEAYKVKARELFGEYARLQ